VTLTTGAAKVSGGVRSIRAVPSPRSRIVDACPGALRLHAAADGPLARVRLPGGLVTGAQLRTLREVAETWGDGHLELTSRANVQLRALTEAPPGALADRLAGAGLLPSDTHELVRNITAAITPAVRPLIRELDRALCADPRLAELPGRFLFAIGGSAVADITACGTATDSPEDTWPAGPAAGPGRIVIRLAGEDVGLRVSHDQIMPAMLAAAHAFLDERAAQAAAVWRLRELADGPARVGARVAAALEIRLVEPEPRPIPEEAEYVGIVTQPDGLVAAGALVPLGRLGGVPMRALEKAELIVVTPGRGVVVPDLAPSVAPGWVTALGAAGLAVETASRWSGVTSCAGRPGCAKSLADVRGDATAATAATTGAELLPVHWVGCARGCGSPAGAHVRVEATTDGYRVTGGAASGRAPATDVGTLVTAARRA
jgi:precorrin-3B synthase